MPVGLDAADHLPPVRPEVGVEVRKACMQDVGAIHYLIKYWAERGLMLIRSHNHLYENIRDFFVLEDGDGVIVGVAGLHVLWHNLAEIRGLALHPSRQGEGLGRWLVLACEREARDLGLLQVFAWTLQVRFFERLGYQTITREALPPKVWSECNACPFYENCREIAVSKSLERPTPAEID